MPAAGSSTPRPRSPAWPSPALVLILLAAATGASGSEGGARVSVAVSLPPLAWPVEQLVADGAEITVLLPPGASPHAWEPTPRQRVALARADLVLRIGHPSLPFEARLLSGREPTSAGTAAILDLCAAADCSSSGESPHPWLEPAAMGRFATQVAAALARLLPARRSDLERRLGDLGRRIDRLDQEVRGALAGLEHRRFYVDHPAWGAFARAYGLEQVAIEAGGKEPGPRRLVALIEQGRSDRARVVFTERGSNGRAARALAAELGAAVVVLDPLAGDWADNLVRTARSLQEALR